MQYNKKLGNCKFTKIIKESDHSIVYLCFDELKNKYYAVKAIPKSVFGDPSIVAKIEKRIHKITSLRSLQLTTIYKTKKTTDNLYIFREYCPHNSLEDFLSNKSYKRVSEKEAIKIMRPLLEAMNLLHRIDMIHGNIKPQNIVINNNIFKLSDFAVPEIANISTLKAGTINYRAPEMLFSKEYDDKVDIWSIGVVMYEMIMGKRLFNGFPEEVKDLIKNHKAIDFSQLSEIGVKISKECQDLLNKMICVDPKERISWDGLWGHQVWKESNIATVEERLAMIHADDLSRSAMLRTYQKLDRVTLNLKYKNQMYDNDPALKTDILSSNVSKFQDDREFDPYNKDSIIGSKSGRKIEDSQRSLAKSKKVQESHKSKKINSKINEESDDSDNDKKKKNTKNDDDGYNDEVIRSKNTKFAPKKQIQESNASEISNDSIIKKSMQEGERKKIEVNFQKDSNYHPGESEVKNSEYSKLDRRESKLSDYDSDDDKKKIKKPEETKEDYQGSSAEKGRANTAEFNSEFSFHDKSMITPEQDYLEQSKIKASKCEGSQIKQSMKNSDCPLEYSQDTAIKGQRGEDSTRVIQSYLEDPKKRQPIEESSKGYGYVDKKEHDKSSKNKKIEEGLDKCSLIKKQSNIEESVEPDVHVKDVGDLKDSIVPKKPKKKSNDSYEDEDSERDDNKTPEESYAPKKPKGKKGKEAKSNSDSDFRSDDSEKDVKKKDKTVERSNVEESHVSKKSKIKKQKSNSDSDFRSDDSDKGAKKKVEQSNIEKSHVSKKSKVEKSNIEESQLSKKSKVKAAKNIIDSDLDLDSDKDDMKKKEKKVEQSNIEDSKKSKVKKDKEAKSNSDSDFRSDDSDKDAKKKVKTVEQSNIEASIPPEKDKKAVNKVRPKSDSDDYISDDSNKNKKEIKKVEESNIGESKMSNVGKKPEKIKESTVEESHVSKKPKKKAKLSNSSSDIISDDDLDSPDQKKKIRKSSDGERSSEEEKANKNSDSEGEKTIKSKVPKKKKSFSSGSEDDPKPKPKKKKSSSLDSSDSDNKKASRSKEVIESETELVNEEEKKKNEERALKFIEESQFKQKEDELNFNKLKIRYLYVRNILNYIGKIVFEANLSTLYLTFLYSYIVSLKKLSKFYEEIIPVFKNTNYFNSPIFNKFKNSAYFDEAINFLESDKAAIDAQITSYLNDLKEQKQKTTLYQDVDDFLSADSINIDQFKKILKHFIKNRESHIQSMKKYLKNMTIKSVKLHFALFLDCMKWQEVNELKLDDQQECGFELEVYYKNMNALTEEELSTKIEKDSTYLLNKGEFLNLGFNHLKD